MNILIVEDDTVIADAIGITLSQAGYHHVHNKTIEGALNELNHNHRGCCFAGYQPARRGWYA